MKRSVDYASVLKKVQDVLVGDEIIAFLRGMVEGRHRVRVTQIEREGDYFRVEGETPYRPHWKVSLVLRRNTSVRAFLNRYELDKATTVLPFILEAVERKGNIGFSDLLREVRQHTRCRPDVARYALNLLLKEGKITSSWVKHEGVVYKRLLPRKVGLVVSELPGTRSCRRGRIIGWKRVANGFENPVVRWEDGSESMCYEGRLEILEGMALSHFLAKEKRKSQYVPPSLLDIYYVENGRLKFDGRAVYELCEWMGWVVDGRYAVRRSEIRNRVLDLLDEKRPGWRSSLNAGGLRG